MPHRFRLVSPGTPPHDVVSARCSGCDWVGVLYHQDLVRLELTTQGAAIVHLRRWHEEHRRARASLETRAQKDEAFYA